MFAGRFDGGVGHACGGIRGAKAGRMRARLLPFLRGPPASRPTFALGLKLLELRPNSVRESELLGLLDWTTSWLVSVASGWMLLSASGAESLV